MFKEKVIQLISRVIPLPKEKIALLIETPPNPSFGDFAFPCYILTDQIISDELWEYVEKDFFIKKNPSEIASHIKNQIKKLPKEIEKIEVKGPYINFFINKELLAKQIISINNNYGRGKQKENIILEHTSVNPNASPHVGRARNSIIGDSIYRILTFLGNKIERHYYVNDVSKQIAMLALVVKPKDSFENLLRRYIDITKKIEKNPELEKKAFELLLKFENGNKEVRRLFKNIVSIAVSGQKKVFSSIGIEFDYFDYESDYINESKKLLEKLESSGFTFRDQYNRLVLDLKSTSMIHSMKSPVLVLTRSDGTGLYIARDLAYTIQKLKKGKNIWILGEDQKLYAEQLSTALRLLNMPHPEVLHYSFVLLKGIGKMSTRKGELVLLEGFLNFALKKAQQEINKRKTNGDPMKVAIAAVKYAMLRNENNKNITFDLEESLKFEGNTGPYLQYSYARASSIIRNSSINPKVKIHTLNNYEFSLIVKISQFPEVVLKAGQKREPHLISNFSFELAKIFNEFYQNCKVIGSDEEAFRIRLVDSFRITLCNSLYLLGIDVMEEM